MALVVFEVEGDSIFALGYAFGLAEDADGCLVGDCGVGCCFVYGVEFHAPVVEALGFMDVEDAARDEES